MRYGQSLRALLACAGLAVGGGVTAATPPETREVELFAGRASGELAVEFVAISDERGRLQVRNLTDKPLNVRLPAAFAAVPVLAQFNDPFAPPKPKSGTGGTQPVGGAARQGNAGQPPQFPPLFQNNGVFNIPPERARRIEIDCVCLDFGKREPRPAIPYEICPLETVCDAPELPHVIRQLVSGDADRAVVQAAAWHLANGLSWDQLAEQTVRRLQRGRVPRFSGDTLERARQLVEEARTPTLVTSRTGSESKSSSAP